MKDVIEKIETRLREEITSSSLLAVDIFIILAVILSDNHHIYYFYNDTYKSKSYT